MAAAASGGAVVAALCCVWYALGSAGNVAGKLLLTELPLPLTATLAQLAAAAALSHAALAAPACAAPAAAAAPTPWRALLPLAAAKLATTLLSQVSLWKVPVSYAHTVKATTPLWTAALTWALMGERPSARVVAALGLIAGGVALASATELQFDGVGLGAALAAAALLAAQHLCSKRALTAGLPALALLRALATLALLALLPAWLLLDARALLSALRGPRGARTGVLLAADALLAWLQALAALAVLSRLSPLGYGVASAAKRAAVIAASLLLLGNPAPPLNLAGMSLAALGVLAYNRARARRAPPPARYRPLLPV